MPKVNCVLNTSDFGLLLLADEQTIISADQFGRRREEKAENEVESEIKVEVETVDL